MDYKESIKRGVLFGFVPHPLAIPDRPDLNVFPFNVLFMRFGLRNGVKVSGSAVYEPMLETLKVIDTKRTLGYKNIYSNGYLEIEYDEKDESYTGTKFVGGEFVGMADGVTWDRFFQHFTAIGLVNGETCRFEEIVEE